MFVVTLHRFSKLCNFVDRQSNESQTQPVDKKWAVDRTSNVWICLGHVILKIGVKTSKIYSLLF